MKWLKLSPLKLLKRKRVSNWQNCIFVLNLLFWTNIANLFCQIPASFKSTFYRNSFDFGHKSRRRECRPMLTTWPLYHHTGLIVKRFIKCPFPGLFSFIAICPTVNNKTRDLYKILPMTGFKQRISTNWVTTTAHSRLATVQRFSHLILTAQILLNELAH